MMEYLKGVPFRTVNNGNNDDSDDSDRPAEMPRAVSPFHDQMSQKAAEAAQAYLDQVEHIAELTHDLEHWRARATTAEHEVNRLLAREQELTDAIDRRAEENAAERDRHQRAVERLTAKFEIASKVILDAFGEIERPKPREAVKVDVKAIESAISDPEKLAVGRSRHCAPGNNDA